MWVEIALHGDCPFAKKKAKSPPLEEKPLATSRRWKGLQDLLTNGAEGKGIFVLRIGNSQNCRGEEPLAYYAAGGGFGTAAWRPLWDIQQQYYDSLSSALSLLPSTP